MPRRRKLRLLNSVACLLAVAALLVGGALTLRWYARYEWPDRSYVSVGQCVLIVCRPGPPKAVPGFPARRATRPGLRYGDTLGPSRSDPDWWFDVTWKSASDFYIEIPMWAVALLPLAPGALIRHLLRDAAAPRSHCVQCGYDLAGNTTGTCPECGTPIANATGHTT